MGMRSRVDGVGPKITVLGEQLLSALMGMRLGDDSAHLFAWVDPTPVPVLSGAIGGL